MMRNTKRWASLFLAVSLTAGVLSGCGNSAGEAKTDKGAAAASEPVGEKEAQKEEMAKNEGETEESSFANHLEISIGSWDVETNFTKTPDDKVLKAIEDRFNVTFVPQNLTWDDYGQKLQLWAASDSLPDLFVGGERTKSTFSKWAKEGLLKEIPSDLSKYEYLNAYMDSPELATCQVDGKTWCIFRQTHKFQAATATDRTLAYRWDLAQEAGITKEPETWDEFREMILAIEEADPEGKGIQGLTTSSYTFLAGIFLPYTMPLGAVDGVAFYWVDKGDGTYIPAYLAGENLGDDALPVWHLLRDMYEEGTIEKDVAVITSSQALEKFMQGSNAAIVIDGGAGSVYDKIGKYWPDIYEGSVFMDAVKILDLMPDINGNQTYPIWDYAWSESYISSHVDDEKLDRILSIYDYLLSEEGKRLSICGIEGESYTLDEQGNVSFDVFGTPSDIFGSIGTFNVLVQWAGRDDFPRTDPQEYIDIDDARKERAKKLPVPEYNYDCTSAFIGLGTDFALHPEMDMLSIMTGSEDVEKMWNEIVDGYKANGLEDIIDQVNEAVK